ncbi:bacteriohemerythrin [Herbaspirillum sp. RV1423]|uniref:bacteriohemerythrin n=1 Tax=Herbaspirillum sp. RV1423 TaxID=1443993 RepID=UPI0004AF99EB|nr:hemerythrin domain-containing protein [Herbaspirillum sp. RV1423]
MEQLTWSPALSLGIAEMDNAHKALIQELTDIMQVPDHEFAASLQRIVDLLETDFREEEELMEKIGYADLRAHREDHAELLSTLHHVVPKAMSGDYVLPRQVLAMLPQWFLGHLVKMDAALVKALNLAGAQPVEHD